MPRNIWALILLSMCSMGGRGQAGYAGNKPAAQTRPTSERSREGYCEYVAGVAGSETARLLAPDVFVAAGVFNSERLAEASIALPGRNPGRVLAGAEFSVGNLQRGLAMKQRARADCEAYGVSAQLVDILQNNSNPMTTRAVAAKAAVLRDALPEGDAILMATHGAVEVFAATVQEADAIRLRLDELRRMLEQTERDAVDATPSEAFTTTSLPKLMQEVELTQGILETAEARVRETPARDLTVRGGYERIFIANQGQPFFVMGTISFNLGALRQKRADKRAQAGKRLWLPQQPDGILYRTARLIRQLRAVRSVEAARLQETQVLLTDLEQRIESVQDVGARKANSYANYLWFDYVKLKAENAYLAAHVEDLEKISEEGSQ